MKAQTHPSSHEVWPEKSAARHMVYHVPLVKSSMTAGAAQRFIHRNIHTLDAIDYLYVVDKNNRLVEVLSLRDVLLAKPTLKLSRLCKGKTLITISPSTPQKKAAHLALHFSLKSIPVVDELQHMIGIVPTKRILSIIHREGREEVLHRAGIHRSHADVDDILAIPLFTAFRHRLPWLIVGLFGGMLAALIVGIFEKTLSNNLVIAGFIPLIAYMSAAVGTQIEVFVIRDLSMNARLPFLRYTFRHSVLVIFLGLTLSVIFGVTSMILYGDGIVSLVVSLALFFTMISALLSALLVPYVLSLCNTDPANATGPLATIIQDITSVTLYLLIASWFL